jgi:hypothetical protein
MADAPEIKVKLTAEDTGVAAAIKELGAQLKNLKKQQDETASSGLTLSKVFAGIAAAGALIKLKDIGREAFDSAVNIGKLSDKTGISTQTLSVFHKVAGDVGASTESVDKALIKAAKSITDFQGGTGKAAAGFKILGINAKDFAGINSDQKLQLVTTKLGGMEKGFQKATAQAAIFGKGASDITLVANSLAGQGFDAATKATARLGLLLDQTTTDSFRAAKASMQELSDVGKGLATQFEAGMLPAISDVGEALLDALGDDGAGSAFKELGKGAGYAIRGIVAGILSIGVSAGTSAAEVAELFDYAFNHTKEAAKTVFAAIGGYIKSGVGGAAVSASLQIVNSGDSATKEFAARIAAIEGEAKKQQDKIYNALFPSDGEEARRAKERAKRLRPDKTTDAPDVTARVPNDRAESAQLALEEKRLQDELAIHRAYAKQTEDVDKDMYERGEITISEYFDRRKVAIQADAVEETAILQRELALQQANVAKFAKEKGAAATPKDADKSEALRLQALGKVDELQTKITTTQLGADAKTAVLDAEQFKAKNDNNAKLLEFEKLIDTSAGKRREAAQAEIEVEKQKLAIILAQSGASQAQIAAELARYQTVKTAEVDFQEQQKTGGAQLKELDDQKAAIEDRVKSGQLFQVQADEQIRQAEIARLPVLQQIADALKQQAAVSGTEEDAAKAADFQKQVDQVKVQSNLAGQQLATLKQGLQQSLTSGFEQFFEQIGKGTESIGQDFKNLAASIIGSIGKMIAQMLIQIAVAKLLQAALGFSGGGVVSGASSIVPGQAINGLAAAEGGLIKGPGGPKSDAIPARVSPGEYIVKAEAVSSFGVHNLEAINRGLQIPSLERLSLPKFAEGGLVGASAASGSGSGNIKLGIGLDEGLILKHLSSKQAGRIVLQHIVNNPKAAGKALSRSGG